MRGAGQSPGWSPSYHPATVTTLHRADRPVISSGHVAGGSSSLLSAVSQHDLEGWQLPYDYWRDTGSDTGPTDDEVPPTMRDSLGMDGVDFIDVAHIMGSQVWTAAPSLAGSTFEDL
jgi:hypothetical protein